MEANSTVTYIVQSSQGPLIDFLVQLAATLIGVIVGFYLTFAWDRKKKKDDAKDIRNLTLDAIIEELKTIQNEILTTPLPKYQWNPSQNFFSGTRIEIPTTAFQSVVNSGNFSLLSSPLQRELGLVYMRIRKCQSYNDEIAQFYFTPLFSNNNTSLVNREATRLESKFNEHIVKLNDEVIAVLPKLELAKEIPKKKKFQFLRCKRDGSIEI